MMYSALIIFFKKKHRKSLYKMNQPFLKFVLLLNVKGRAVIAIRLLHIVRAIYQNLEFITPGFSISPSELTPAVRKTN